MNIKPMLKISLVVILLGVASLACNLPIYEIGQPESSQNTPAPTLHVNSAVPTFSAPAANANAGSADSTPPIIGQISTSANPIYFGGTNCGTTTLTIEATITDDAGSVTQVGIQYRYNGYAANALGNWRKANLNSTGNNKYSLTIQVDSEANADMAGNDGVLEYQLFAFDATGNIQTEPNGHVFGVEVKKCSQQSSGSSSSGQSSSNQQPSSPGNDTSPPKISNAVTSSAPVYYIGNSCGPTSLTIEANVSDNSNNIKSVIARYRYNGQAANAVGNFREVAMTNSGGKYKLSINIDIEANQDMNGNDGVLEYQIIATDSAGNATTHPDGGHPLGVEVKNCNPGGVVSNNPPQGGAAISISNVRNSSQAVNYGVCTSGEATFLQIEATIDPVDQIASAVVKYDYGQGLILIPFYTFSSSMYQLGFGDYAADINVGSDAFGYISGDGWIEYVIEVTDKNGLVTTSNVYGADVYLCQTQVNVTPLINDFSGPNGSLNPNDPYTLQWDTSDADCGVYLDGSQVNPSDSISYSTPGDNSYQTWTHTLVAKGAPCDNPSEVSDVVQIVVEPAASVSKGSGSIFDEFSRDLGDGNGDDIIYDSQSNDEVLLSVWGAQLAVYYGGQPSVADCKAYVDSGAYTSVSITTYDIVCYKTGSGNYGFLTIDGMFLDLDNQSNSYIDVSYSTEVAP